MENNIFKDAYFGKAYKTRDGRKAIYHSYNNLYPDNPYEAHHNLILEKIDGKRDTVWIWANDYGHIDEHIEGKWLVENETDIISEWDEEIDEDKLQALQAKCLAEDIENGVMKSDMGHYYPNDEQSWIQGYAVGFHKAYRIIKKESL